MEETGKKFDKKSLKKRLACIILFYMDGLGSKRKEKLSHFVTKKLDDMVDYYIALLKKKERKDFIIPELTPEILENHLKDFGKDKTNSAEKNSQTKAL